MFQVPCECGANVEVHEGHAGRVVACNRCGGSVAVPPLSDLRLQAGLALVSPELQIDSMLAHGELPEDNLCVVCDAATNEMCHCWTECQRARTAKRGGLGLDPANLLSIFFGNDFYQRDDQNEIHGRDVVFRLPLRVCANCRNIVSDEAMLKKFMCRVPAYARLLEKYPAARISIARSST